MDKDKTPSSLTISDGDIKPQDSPTTDNARRPRSDSLSDSDSVSDSAAVDSKATHSAKPAETVAASNAPGGADSASSAGSITSPSSARGTKTPGKRGAFKTLVWLVLVIALVAAGYYLWSRYGEQFKADYLSGEKAMVEQSSVVSTAQESSAQPVTDTQNRDATANTAALVTALNEEIEARKALEEQLSGQIADLHLQLNSYDDRLRSLSTTSREDWLLAEAEYLLRLASQRILTERQSANALALMESADSILRDFNDTELFAVRRALANDITRVQMVAAVDREGIYLRLGALVDAVDELDSLLPELPAPAQPVAIDPDALPPPWYQRLLHNAREAVVKMVGLVRIERRDVPLEPLLSLEQEQALRHNLKVVLEQARLGLLREEQGIYTASLERAAGWVKGNFESDAVSAVFVAEIADLKQQSVVQELPSLTGSIRALQEYIRLWHNRYEGSDQTDLNGQELQPQSEPESEQNDPTVDGAEDSQ